MRSRFFPFETVVLAFLAAAILLGVVSAWVDVRWFREVYVVEDGPIEWATFAALLAGAAVSAWTWDRRSVRGARLRAMIWCGLAALCLFAAGEEISWGQRIFGWSSPSFFLQHNAQHETNLHNLVVAGVKVNRIVFSKLLVACAAVYLLVLPALHRRHAPSRRAIDALGVPVARTRHVLTIAATLVLVGLVASGKRDELGELAAATMFLLILLFPSNAAAIHRHAARPRDDAPVAAAVGLHCADGTEAGTP
jgi:hypothetical protein